ncbi:MAG TPA: penicillin acylase family protein, partial [Burkholderiales bacterium]|nr:penicillin acylase family protein [Burkholderiales bacterium]
NGTRGDTPPADLTVPGLREEVRIAWDARHVPHIFAANDHDLCFAQGYVTARDRLWQMEFQLLYAAGRISEVIGPMGLQQDLFNRRFGMVWAAENSLRKCREDPGTREAMEAYTAGVNAYIGGLGPKDLPIEYKILDYRPEPWTELKCALLLKTMAYMLTSYHRDALLTAVRDALGESAVWALFPVDAPLVDPVIPRGTVWDFTPIPLPVRAPEAALKSGPGGAGAAPSADEGAFGPIGTQPGPGIGSNDWAVSGKLTKSGYPILCNDMHLGLTLPAIWYEVQLNAPGIDVRGVSFPGAPLVVAGYNRDIAWGYTNGTDDVLDWYAIKFKDATRAEYFYDGAWRKTAVREETIKVRGGRTVVDKVVYTHHGPVVRRPGEPGAANIPVDCALRWLGHDGTNELRTLAGLNRARNYDDYVKAMETWDCPSQNIVFADRTTIALWHQGLFPLRRKGQGRFILDGSDPANDWLGWIPRAHNPHLKDPQRGFVSSANQPATDSSYPYYLGADYASFERGARINEILAAAKDVTPEDMIRMQADVLDIRARAVVPRLSGLVHLVPMTDAETKSLQELKNWDFEARAAALAPTIFEAFWNRINALTWEDEKKGGMVIMPTPTTEVMIDLVLNHPDSEWFDDKTTEARETLADIASKAFRTAVFELQKKWGPFGPGWRWG